MPHMQVYNSLGVPHTPENHSTRKQIGLRPHKRLLYLNVTVVNSRRERRSGGIDRLSIFRTSATRQTACSIVTQPASSVRHVS